MTNHPKPEVKQPTMTFHVLLVAALFVFIRTFSVLSPILLSLLLILLISIALNPVISRLRAWTGRRENATGLIVVALVVVVGLTGWAFFVPMKASVTRLAEQLPAYTTAEKYMY
jgi:predicted PurR-regulated permease PerM